jgi:hypothetical protein
LPRAFPNGGADRHANAADAATCAALADMLLACYLA